MSERTSSAGRRLSIITVDQAIAGGSNVLIAVLAAHLLSLASFGLFGIVFFVYVIAQGVPRALVSDPLLVHPVEAQERRGEVIGTGAMLGLGLAVVIAAAGLGVALFDGELGVALLVLAACMPLLALQDIGRYMAIAIQRPSLALTLDVTWLVLLIGALAVLFATDTRELAWLIAAWGGTGALSGLLIFVQHRVHVEPSTRWLRFTWGFSWRYLISYMATQGSALGILIAVGAIAGGRALGTLQGALLLARPFSTFQAAATSASIGEIARAPGQSDLVWGQAVRTSALVAAVAAVNTVVLLVLPDSLGEIALGDVWESAQTLVPAVGLQIVFVGLLTGPRAGVLGMRGIGRVMVVDVVASAAALGAAIAGAGINGAEGAVWGIAIAWAPMPVVWWALFAARVRQGPDGDAAPAATEASAARVSSATPFHE